MKRPHKYNAKAQVVDGIRFASKAEARRYGQLRLLEKAGRIAQLTCHPTFVLSDAVRRPGQETLRRMSYVADFAYHEVDSDGNIDCRWIVEDVKGIQTAVFRMKRRLFLEMYPEHELRIVK